MVQTLSVAIAYVHRHRTSTQLSTGQVVAPVVRPEAINLSISWARIRIPTVGGSVGAIRRIGTANAPERSAMVMSRHCNEDRMKLIRRGNARSHQWKGPFGVWEFGCVKQSAGDD